MGVRRRWSRRALIAVLVALIAAPILLFVIGAAIGSHLTIIGVTVVVLSLLLLSAAVHTAMVLNPQERTAPHEVVQRHVRTAPLVKAAAGRDVRLPDVRRRIAELRERLSWPVGSGFGGGQATLSLIMLGMLVCLLGSSGAGLVRDIADRRYFETVQDLDSTSPTYDSDHRAALAELEAATAPVWRFTYGAVLTGVGLMLAAAARSTFIRHRIRRRFESLGCPDCGYGLREAEPAIPPERLGGILSGPAACPECGSPWPLIPPPTRDEMLSEGARRAPVKRRGRG